MANLLKMANIETIHTLHQQGWSQRRIARELGINRETVARYIARTQTPKPADAPIGSASSEAEAKPANAPVGSAANGVEVKPANAPIGSDVDQSCPLRVISLTEGESATEPPSIVERGRPSDCEPWRQWIQDKCRLGLSAQRIYQDLVTEQTFPTELASGKLSSFDQAGQPR